MIDTRLTHCLWLTLYLMVLCAAVARADIRHPIIHENRCEIIELNHTYEIRCYDDRLCLHKRMSQLIFRDEMPPDTFGNRKPCIVDWKLWGDDLQVEHDGRGQFILFDDKGTLRRVRSHTEGFAYGLRPRSG